VCVWLLRKEVFKYDLHFKEERDEIPLNHKQQPLPRSVNGKSPAAAGSAHSLSLAECVCFACIAVNLCGCNNFKKLASDML
jgi:hypothetical protein